MNNKLSTIKWVNFTLIFLLSLHLPIELLLYQGFRISVFSEMHYVLFLCITLAIQCRLLARSESIRSIRICHHLGTLLFAVLFAVIFTSMMHFDSKGTFTFEGILGRVAAAYFVPFLMLGLDIQLYIKFSHTYLLAEKVFCIVNFIVTVAYLIHSIIHYLDIRHFVAFADMLVIYLPVFLLINIVFWLIKQFGDTIRSLRGDPAPQ